jgi:hypothetical protein
MSAPAFRTDTTATSRPPALTSLLLSDHPHQSATAIDGWKSILFGIPFAIAGVAMSFASVHVKPPATGPTFPRWAMGVFDFAFLGGGLFFIGHGLRESIRDWRYRRAAAANPGQPWLYDYRWRDGFRYSAIGTVVQRFATALGWCAFVLPFGWVGLEAPGERPFLYFAIAFELMGLFLWYRWGVALLDYFRYGNTYLRYDSAPYFVGGALHAHLRAPRHLAAIDELTLTLRCVQERYVTTGTGRDRSTSVECYELYSDSSTIPREQLAAVGEDGIPVEFTLPPGVPTTTLASHPPTYWEIEAGGQAREVDYRAYFLVPVYTKAG